MNYSSYLIYVMPALLISMWASWNVKTTFSKYNRIGNRRGYTGAMVARRILDMNGLQHIRIERVSGSLTDHFDPSAGVIRLSDSTYSSTSVGALGVAAHECGHAIQHHLGYGPLKLRSLSVPIANIGSSLSWPLILLGLIMGWTGLAQVGVFLFTFVVLFQLITLPVEFNASSRALKILEGAGILMDTELRGASKVLRAAAMTYVASLLGSILQLLRLVLLTRGGRRR